MPHKHKHQVQNILLVFSMTPSCSVFHAQTSGAWKHEFAQGPVREGCTHGINLHPSALVLAHAADEFRNLGLWASIGTLGGSERAHAEDVRRLKEEYDGSACAQ